MGQVPGRVEESKGFLGGWRGRGLWEGGGVRGRKFPWEGAEMGRFPGGLVE